MNIKTKLLGLFLTFITSTGICQDNKKEIEQTFQNYLTAIINQDFDKSMNFISEDFFKIIPKEQLILLMEKTFNNPEIEFELKDPKIIEIKDSELIENKYYSLLTYSNKMNMKFNRNNENQETEEDYKLRMSLTKVSLEQNFGQKNVNYNDSSNFFEIYVEKQVYAISTNGQTDWKFIVLEKKQKPILERVLPKQLTDRI
jgi:hypothetical protein